MIFVRLLATDIEAECQDDYMKIRIGFNGSFTGLLYSAGMRSISSTIKFICNNLMNLEVVTFIIRTILFFLKIN